MTKTTPMNPDHPRLEQRLRDDAAHFQDGLNVNIADRMAGQWPSVDRTVKRGGASAVVFALSLLALAAAVVGVTMFNQPGTLHQPIVAPSQHRIMPEPPITRDDVRVQLASWTLPLETEARAIASDLTNSVTAVRRRLPILERLKKNQDEPSSSD